MTTSFLHPNSTTVLNLWTCLPSKWNKICDVDYDVDADVNATLNCHVTPGALWRLADLRLALGNLVQSTGLEVAVNLQCDTEGKVSLPWPYRAPGLVKLKVASCQLLDKYADFNTTAEQIEDSLRVLDMRDSIWFNDPKEFDRVIDNSESVTLRYQCGQVDTLAVYRYHNITDVTLGGDSATSDPSEDARKSSIEIKEMPSGCRHKRLEIQDESASVPLARNHFQNMVDGNTFPALRVLNYSYTGLGEVSKELREWRVFFDQSPMELMDLSHNGIKEVGNIQDYGNPTENLTTTLNLQFNRIAKISFQMFEAWSWVRDFVVDIRNNPIDCSCDMLDLKDLVTQLQDDSKWAEQPMQTYRHHLSVMRCATPPKLSGRVIDSLSAEDLSCLVEKSGPYVQITVVQVLVLLGLLIMLFLAVKYRKEIRMLLFTRVHVLLPCGARKPLKGFSEKVFDAFVAYAHQDSDWVLGSLLKRLEEPSNARGCGPVKLCIHQRDFVVGKPIIDNIIDSIAASRHTIIVLSKSFVKSSWAMEELQQAYRQSLEERRRHLLVVRLEEVPESEMAPVLRRCCKTFTHIQASDPLFWDRLQYSLQTADEEKNRVAAVDEFHNVAYSVNEDREDALAQHTLELETFTSDSNQKPDSNATVLFSETMRAVSLDRT
ncbi:toll-like receptor Tollo [Littorina saxatilis]|uniref:TIR domain-containing protein n=1 Tax=Littorina saxatilis TaxID=31220 RepID=A0AAN9C4L1_9CAEN